VYRKYLYYLEIQHDRRYGSVFNIGVDEELWVT